MDKSTSVYCLPDKDVYNILTRKQHCPVLFPLVKFTQDQISISVTHQFSWTSFWAQLQQQPQYR
jgi:hypothetical protein